MTSGHMGDAKLGIFELMPDHGLMITYIACVIAFGPCLPSMALQMLDASRPGV